MRTLRNILQIVCREKPITLARETLWRATRKWRANYYRHVLESATPSVRIRQATYYDVDLSAISAEQRQVILQLADEICLGHIPFLSYGTQELGLSPPWSRDFISGKEWPMQAGQSLALVRFDGSDVKVPWELSRLQFLPVLGKAFCLSNDPRYRDAARHFVDDWIRHNPAGRGVNWTVAMEVALRALSVLLLINLLRPFGDDESPWMKRVAESMWQHMIYIEGHLEFSHIVRGNHYLSNLVGLYGLAVFLDGPDMERRRQRYRLLLEREIMLHTYEDGGHFEASTGYHALVSQLFLTAYQLMKAEGAVPSPAFTDRLRKMFQWMEALASPEGGLPHVGDCDDGRVELMFDDLGQMATVPVPERDSLRVKSLIGLGFALLGCPASVYSEDAPWYRVKNEAACRTGKHFDTSEMQSVHLTDSGIAVMRWREADLLFCAVPNGIHGKGSHTHNDKLSIILRLDGEEILCDPGTGCYTRDAITRNLFRSTLSHNTVVVDGQEQNRIPEAQMGVFSLGDEAQVSPLHGDSTGRHGFSAEHIGYASLGAVHRRAVRWESPRQIDLEDMVQGSGPRRIELNFQLGPGVRISGTTSDGSMARCTLQGKRKVNLLVRGGGVLHIATAPSQISRLYGTTGPAWKLSIAMDAQLPTTLKTTLSWEE
ncbi:MAG TPA: alginate lyase family protein [Candidatus Angelobacter sp.]